MSTNLSIEQFYPCPSKAFLCDAFVGKHLKEIPTPAAVLDRAIVERNCRQMLESCTKLGVSFRAHVKTHKTLEVTSMQIGQPNLHPRIVVSTLAEAEHLAVAFGFLHTPQTRPLHVLYGVPPAPSQARRLGHLSRKLGDGGFSLLIDNTAQLECLQIIYDISRYRTGLYVKIDTGYHRAGLQPDSPELEEVLAEIIHNDSGSCYLEGFYSHAGHSYGVDTRAKAMSHLSKEIKDLLQAATVYNSMPQAAEFLKQKPLVLSVGATPSATSIESLAIHTPVNVQWHREATELRKDIDRCRDASYDLEIHAGVYPFLDMQQLATNASPSASDRSEALSTEDIALTVLGEVASVYSGRDAPEALITTGTLALGREPCKSYNGWGRLSPWRTTAYEESGWIVGRITQEHGILTRDPNITSQCELKVGDKLRIWPNHACIAGACYGWYLVVDSSLPESQRDMVVDVWVRWRGW